MRFILLIFAAMLLLCLADMPYGYYELVRFIAMILFGYMAVLYYRKESMPLTVTFAGLALLFQPFVKIALGRTIWNIVDVIVAVLLILLLLNSKRKEL